VRKPTSPVAKKLKCDIKTVNRIIKGRTRVTANMAIKLSRFFKTTPQFWLNAQMEMEVNAVCEEYCKFSDNVKTMKFDVWKRHYLRSGEEE